MTTFEMVKYHAQLYPEDIPLRIEECAAHLDVTSVNATLQRSLHTEYSYGKRKLDSELLSRFPAIIAASKDGVPQLWKNEQWSYEFAQFVISIAGDVAPTVIEVHPPFSDYTDYNQFVQNYHVFEDLIIEKYPNVTLLIENRCGSVYKGGRFLISKTQDVEQLCNLIVQSNLRLKIAYDIPQIYTAHNVKKQNQFIELLQKAKEFRDQIGGVHLWSKRRAKTGRKVAHCGDLTSYFEDDLELKTLFLEQFCKTFDDGICRKMVLEVNSGNDDLLSIIADLHSIGVIFV